MEESRLRRFKRDQVFMISYMFPDPVTAEASTFLDFSDT